MEVGTLRAILRRNRLWAALQPDVKMLPTRDDVGRAISPEEEMKLLEACSMSRSRSLTPSVTLAVYTCMRLSELRLSTWKQVDFMGRTITVGKSKTDSGTGRVIPLNIRAYNTLRFWASQFPGRQPDHYIFPAERYGAAGDDFKPCSYNIDPTKPIGRWKEAWEAAKVRSGVNCRYHDLRHTGCTRMLESGVPFAVVASLMGWSAATTVRMAKRYGHIGQVALKRAVESISGGVFEAGSFANPFDVAAIGKSNAAN